MRYVTPIVLLATAAFAPLGMIGNPGCYPHDYDPDLAGIQAPSEEQTEAAADAAATVAGAGAAVAGQPLLSPILEGLARGLVALAAFLIARTYPPKQKVDAPKESKQ